MQRPFKGDWKGSIQTPCIRCCLQKYLSYCLRYCFVSALAIHCYQCQPSQNEIMSYMQSKMAGNTTEPLCSNPTEVFDCSQDPNIGMVADSCLTTSITLNSSMVGEFSYNILNCSVKSFCSMTKNITCGALKSAFQSIPVIDLAQCDVSCCEGERCNGPSPVNSTSSSSTEGSSSNPGPPSTLGPTAAALQCTKAPSNAAIFSIVCLVYSAITNLF